LEQSVTENISSLFDDDNDPFFNETQQKQSNNMNIMDLYNQAPQNKHNGNDIFTSFGNKQRTYYQSQPITNQFYEPQSMQSQQHTFYGNNQTNSNSTQWVEF